MALIDLCYGREEVGKFLFGVFDEDALTIEPEELPEPFAFTLFPPLCEKFAPYAERAAALFPVLNTAGVRTFINGPETFTPDGKPLIGAIPSMRASSSRTPSTRPASPGRQWPARLSPISLRGAAAGSRRNATFLFVSVTVLRI
ncbi:MAG TPA: hypothetical protein VFL55_08700 [Acetobacteraceae bacterium]|nr:hypothetical protein [Acetobacteraceae bacterium]